MARRSPVEAAERRETQRTARQAASSGRPPGGYFGQRMRGLAPLSSIHQGSKPGYTHLTVLPGRSRMATPAAGQKAIPPQFRTDRAPLAPVVPMGEQDRWDRYTLGGTHRTLTGPQRRRFTHKHGWRMLDLYLGHTSASLPSNVIPGETSLL